MPSRSRRRLAQATMTAALLTVGVVAGCADSGSPDGAVDPGSLTAVDEMALHDGQVCPERLPQGNDPHLGLGTDEPAGAAPSLPAPDSAWVCLYNPTEAGPGPDGDGTTWGWVRSGEARPVPPTRLAALERGLAELVPAAGDRMCTADLGPRWMLVLSHGGDLTGVVVDDFGCRDVRLTDEPLETVPGAATQPGTVSGVLAGPEGFLDDIRAVHGG